MRIRIFGDIASGKSTLAKKLGEEFDIPVFSTDDFVYKKNYSEKWDLKKRKELANNVIKKKNWIIEGVHHSDWILPSSKNADLIIVLKVPLLVLIFRIIKRTLKHDSKRFNFRSMFNLIYMLLRDYKTDFLAYNNIAKEKNNIIAREVNIIDVKNALNKNT